MSEREKANINEGTIIFQLFSFPGQIQNRKNFNFL